MRNNFYKVKMLEFRNIGDPRGYLVVCDGGVDIPFVPLRIFYIYGTKEGIIRGKHANKDSALVLINVAGSSKIKVKDGKGNETVYCLERPHTGLYIPPMVWKEMYDFSDDSVLLCLTDTHYNPDEYIKDYEEYERLINE